MSISDLPLSYCTNVHPGRTLDEVIANLEKYAVPVAEAFGEPMGVGLWFADTAADKVAGDAAAFDDLRDRLEQHGLAAYTLNAFPYGNFHAERVKTDVYRPDWTTEERMEYTVACACALAFLLPPGASGTISTLPLGFGPSMDDPDFIDACCGKLVIIADTLRSIRESKHRRLIRLAIEPEPLCAVETTEQALALFDHLTRYRPSELPMVQEHIGLCYDICHQAVEYEDAAESIARIHDAGIRINKVQISNAIEVPDPANNHAAREALRDYVDVRYLHQTFGRLPDGTIHRVTDLTHAFLDDPGPQMLAAESWRIHYHVPVDQHTVGPLNTTRAEVDKALAAIAKLPYAPHLEVETYTWTVLPGEKPDLVAGLAAELKAVRGILDGIVD